MGRRLSGKPFGWITMNVFTHSDEEDSLIAGDLMRARQFLGALKTIEKSRQSKVIRETLTLASIVSYCRPFMTSFVDASRNKRRKRRWIPAELVDDLPDGLGQLHAQIVEARNQAWAHTDWIAHTPRLGSGGVMSRNPWVPLEAAALAQFVALVDEVLARLQPASAVSTASAETE
ncbi:MAG: hypothetical protein ACHQ4J_15105 [Candidatus Binatia bacterium]